MAEIKEFLGEKAVGDLFDIIRDNFVSKEEIEEREKSLSSSISVGSALIAAALLKVAEAIGSVQGGWGGGTFVDDSLVATDEEADELLDIYFPTEGGIETVESSDFDDSLIATDEEAKELLDSIFPVDDN